MISEIPSTDVIRHWCGWGADEDFSPIRVLQFEAWLEQVREQERERIRANIIDRVRDLSSCHKDDNCQELGALIASYIEEWIDEEEEK